MFFFKRKGKRIKIPESRAAFYDRLARTLATTSKQLIWILTINGILWIWTSYILAFIGREQIAESLSTNVCTVVLGGIVTYIISSAVTNIFRYNEKLGGRSVYGEDVEARAGDVKSEEVEDNGTAGIEDELEGILDPEVPEPEDAG